MFTPWSSTTRPAASVSHRPAWDRGPTGQAEPAPGPLGPAWAETVTQAPPAQQDKVRLATRQARAEALVLTNARPLCLGLCLGAPAGSGLAGARPPPVPPNPAPEPSRGPEGRLAGLGPTRRRPGPGRRP